MKRVAKKSRKEKRLRKRTAIPELDWENDKCLTKWIGRKKESTAKTYKQAFPMFIEFTRMTPEELVLEKWEDMKKPPLEQTNAAEIKVKEFYDYLKEAYKKEVQYAKRDGEGLAGKSASTYIGAVRSFYKANGVKLDFSGFERGLFSATTKKENQTIKLTPEKIEKLASYAPTLRDKAIIWCDYQSGLDISAVLSLNWGDIAEEFRNPPLAKVQFENGEAKEIPSVRIEVTREKAGGKPYRSYICKTAIEMLTKYLVERHGEGFANKMKWDEPLFVNIYGVNAGERYPVAQFERLLKTIAPKTGLVVKERLERANRNPLRPASLRGSFSDSLKRVGCDADYIDYWMGHSTRYGGAYSDAERGDYCKYAYLGLEPKGVSPEVESKLKKTEEKLVETSEDIRGLATGLVQKDKEIAELKERMRKMRVELKRLKGTDGDITKIIEVLEPFVTAPLGMPQPDKTEESLDKVYERSWKVFEELKKRRLKNQ